MIPDLTRLTFTYQAHRRTYGGSESHSALGSPVLISKTLSSAMSGFI